MLQSTGHSIGHNRMTELMNMAMHVIFSKFFFFDKHPGVESLGNRVVLTLADKLP